LIQWRLSAWPMRLRGEVHLGEHAGPVADALGGVVPALLDAGREQLRAALPRLRARLEACCSGLTLLDALAEGHGGRGAAHERLAAPDLALVHLDDDVDHARLGRRSGLM
jgi:hypothetical protein